MPLLVSEKMCSAQTDSLFIEIDSTLFLTNRNTSAIKVLTGGAAEVSIEQMQKFPKTLGNTDPVRFVRSLPGVQTNSEYDSGIHIQGCDNAHNDISISGVPIYGVSHLFGLFSIFNPSHYDRMNFSSSSVSNRLGGTLRLDASDTLSRLASGDISVGVMSSQGSLGIKTGNKSSLKISARQSYLNLLYDKWMKIGGSPTDYSFGDYNLGWFITPSAQDKIWFDLNNHIIRWGKVSISDGEKEVILSGRKDERFFPPYIYTTSKLKGEVGKTYHLKVEYSGRTVTALATIPAPKPLEYIKINESRSNGAQDDGRYFLTGGLKDDRTTKDYYKVFTKVHQKDSIFVSSFLGLTDDTILGEGIEEIPINRGSGVQTTNKDNYYRSGDIVHIRFCTLDKIAWEYWSDFEEIQSLSRNPFFPISTDIRSNISGGLGYWAGYGATYYTISITPSE